MGVMAYPIAEECAARPCAQRVEEVAEEAPGVGLAQDTKEAGFGEEACKIAETRHLKLEGVGLEAVGCRLAPGKGIGENITTLVSKVLGPRNG